MSKRAGQVVGFMAVVLGIGSMAIAAPKDANTPTAPTAPATGDGKAPTYLTVGDMVGDVIKVDSKSITIRVTWYTMQPPKGNNRPYGNWHHGSSGRNPQQMYQHMMYMQQQMMRARPKQNHHDYTMDFAADATARTMHLPPKLDANGKKEGYSPEEFQKMKGNPQLPGFKSDLDSLKVGQLVEAHLVRLPGSEKTKDTHDDLIVRWALIINENNVGKTPANNNPKKKN